MSDVNVTALHRLQANRQHLTPQQFKTLRGQVLSGAHEAAMKGLDKLLTKKESPMKQNPLLHKLEMKHQAELAATRLAVRQEMAEMSAMALGRAFGFGPERNKRFLDALNEVLHETIDRADKDTRDREYAEEKYEQEFRHVSGRYYVDRATRYSLTKKG